MLNATSPQLKAGQQQELDVAFYLRRAFKDHTEVHVINDLKFKFNDEIAQIDHLIVYPYGFILIESKSIKGHVKVNQQGEWTRSFNQTWSGMPSPIKQVELQQDLLNSLLDHHRLDILGKFLGIKQGFGGRSWEHLCAVSSESVIDRKTMPKAVSSKLVKSEFLVDKINKLMKLRNKFIRTVNVYDTRPQFNQQELDSICSFLLEQDISSKNDITPTNQISDHYTSHYTSVEHQTVQIQDTSTVYQQEASNPPNTIAPSILSCKHCGESNNYIPMCGKFGYYIKCNACSNNTPMKMACPSCGSKSTKVQKRQETYTLICQDCSLCQQII